MNIVYYKNRFISISESAVNTPGALNREFNKIHDLNIEIYKFLANNHISSLHLFGKNPDKILKKLKKLFVYVKAAGGVVVNADNEVLIIRRRGKWDLPKGKKDKGEDISTTAIREVSEECGLDPGMIEIVRFIDNAWHIYEENTEFVIKRTTWFEMRYSGNEELQPQLIEDITQAKWVSLNNLGKPMKKTFLNVKHTIDMYLKLNNLPNSYF